MGTELYFNFQVKIRESTLQGTFEYVPTFDYQSIDQSHRTFGAFFDAKLISGLATWTTCPAIVDGDRLLLRECSVRNWFLFGCCFCISW